MISEILSLAIIGRGGIRGVDLASWGTKVTHMLYDDDILITTRASISKARQDLELLEDYYCWIGQRINKAKSAMLFGTKAKGWQEKKLAHQVGSSKV